MAGSAMESDAGTGQRDSRRSGSGSFGSRAGANDRRSTDASAADPLRVGRAVTSVVVVHRPEVTRLHVPRSPRQVTPETAGAARDLRSPRGPVRYRSAPTVETRRSLRQSVEPFVERSGVHLGWL